MERLKLIISEVGRQNIAEIDVTEKSTKEIMDLVNRLRGIWIDDTSLKTVKTETKIKFINKEV